MDLANKGQQFREPTTKPRKKARAKEYGEGGNEFFERLRCRWECIRRNEKSAKAFGQGTLPALGKGTVDHNMVTETALLIKTQDSIHRLSPPIEGVVEEFASYFFCPMSAIFPVKVHYYTDRSLSDEVEVCGPGTIFHGDDSEEGRELTEWTLHHPGTNILEKMTHDNYPRYIQIEIGISLSDRKEVLQEVLRNEFDNAYDTVVAAQKALLGRSKSRFRLAEFDKYMMVYELRQTDPPTSWNDIALKVFPYERPKNAKRRARKPIIASQNEKEKVIYYYEVADRLINHGGWKEI